MPKCRSLVTFEKLREHCLASGSCFRGSLLSVALCQTGRCRLSLYLMGEMQVQRIIHLTYLKYMS